MFSVAVLLLLFSVMLRAVTGNAQFVRSDLYIKKYNTGAGYSGEILMSYRDRMRRFWFISHDAITSFDGTEFRSYTVRNGLLPGSNHVITEDSSGHIYVGNENGISIWQPGYICAFRTFYKREHLTGQVAVADSQDFYVHDRQRELLHIRNNRERVVLRSEIYNMTVAGGKLYAMSSGDTMYVLEGDRVSNAYRIPRAGFVSSQAHFIRERDDRLWFVGAALYRITPAGIADSLPLPPLAASENCSVAMGDHGDYYVAVRNMLYSYKNGMLIQVPDINEYAYDSSLFTVNTGLYIDKPNILWFMNESFGLMKIKPCYYHSGRPNFWFAKSDGRDGTVFYFDDSLKRHPYAMQAVRKLGPNIRYVYEDRKNNLWFCHTNGVALQTPKGVLTSLVLPVSIRNAAENIVLSAVEDRQGGLWLIRPGSVLHYTGGKTTVTGLSFQANDLVIDNRDNVWIAGDYHLTIINSRQAKEVTGMLPAGMRHVTEIAADPEENIWAASADNRIYKLQYVANKITCMDSLDADFRDIPNEVGLMQFDRAGNLWIGYTQDMVVFPKDGNGRYSRTRYIRLTADDGMGELLGNNASGLFNTADGQLLVWGRPVQELYADIILSTFNSRPPEVYFTGLEIFNNVFNWPAGGYKLRADGLPDKPHLRYNQNTVTFHFSSFAPHNTSWYQYQYRLDGVDHDWLDANSTREATYNTLPPGHYTFHVRAANENGIWGTPQIYEFTISPPWYAAWWARCLWIAIAAGLAGYAFYVRQRRMISRYEAEQEIIEQKLIALRAQINPHFIHNIFAFLSHNILHETRETAVATLKKVSVYLRDILYVASRISSRWKRRSILLRNT